MILDWSGRNRKCRAFALAHRRKRLPEGRTDGFTPRPVARFGGTGVKYRAGEGGRKGEVPHRLSFLPPSRRTAIAVRINLT